MFENGKWTLHQRQAPQADIRSIYALPGGKIWVDTDLAFHIFDEKSWRWQKITYDSDILGNNPPFTCDSEGRLYFVNSSKNLVILDSNNGSINEYASGQLIFPVVGAFSDNNTLYIGSYIHTSEGGIYKFDGKSVTKFKDGMTRSLTVDHSGILWATHIKPGETDISLLVLENENGTWDDRTDELVESLLGPNMTVKTSVDGSIWVNNNGDYEIYEEENWEFYDGGSNVAPIFLKFDISGGVWGYGFKKLYRLNDVVGNWEISREMDVGIEGKTYFLAELPDSTVWTVDSKNIYRYDENEEDPWVLVESPYDLASDAVTCIAYTGDGRLVCGHGRRFVEHKDSEKAGISILTDSTWYNCNYHVFSESDTLRFHNVYDLLELGDGDIMVYTDIEFSLFDGDNWEHVDSLYFINDVGYEENFTENDMIVDDYGTVWIGTSDGLFEHDFVDLPEVRVPSESISYSISFDNLYMDKNRNIYMQNTFGSIIEYENTSEGREWKYILSADRNIRDFVVTGEGSNIFLWAARDDNISWWNGIQWEPLKFQNTPKEIFFKNASFIHLDEDDRMWASGYDNTGYFEGGIWHRIPELTNTASDVFAWTEDGKKAFNSIEIIQEYPDDPLVINYYGVYEFSPDQQSIVSEYKPDPFFCDRKLSESL